MPAVERLALRRLLPASFSIVGVARTEMDDEEFLQRMMKTVLDVRSDGEEGDGSDVRHVWDAFSGGFRYVAGDYSAPETFVRLREVLEELDRERGTAGNRLYYLATPARHVPDRGPGPGRPGSQQAAVGRGLRPHRHREALRAGREVGGRARPDRPRGVRRVAGVPHRPLPGEGDRPERPRPALRQRHLRAPVEPALRQPRADHGGRVARRGPSGQLLRAGGGAARHRPEPRHAGAGPHPHGAARPPSTPTASATRR